MFVKKLMKNMIRTYCLYISSINFETINIKNVYFDRQMNVLFVVAIEIDEIKNDKNIMFHFYMKLLKIDVEDVT